MVSNPPPPHQACDRCRVRPWAVQLLQTGIGDLAYCQKCIIGVLPDRPDVRYFRLRFEGWPENVAVSRKWLRRALASEPLR